MGAKLSSPLALLPLLEEEEEEEKEEVVVVAAAAAAPSSLSPHPPLSKEEARMEEEGRGLWGTREGWGGLYREAPPLPLPPPPPPPPPPPLEPLGLVR